MGYNNEYDEAKERALTAVKSSSKGIIFLTIVGVCLMIALIFSSKIFETVEKGTYQVKQAAVSGSMSAKMKPGLWFQLFGDIEPFPNQETFYFTSKKDTPEDVDADESIEVRFVDGSICHISGTCRIIMPRIEQDAIDLVLDGYKTYPDVSHKLILPTLRNVLRHTANMMTARESYAEQRQDFVLWSKDQLKHGLYKTIKEERDVKDLATGEMVKKTFKKIYEIDGIPQYEDNPMSHGISVANFEVKKFNYDDEVKKQIDTQQKALMAVATAKAQAIQAEQEAKKVEAQGKQAVMLAKYEKEQVKVRAIVEATQEKEVALIKASRKKDQSEIEKDQAIIEGTKRKEVAKLDRDAAILTKEEQILLGQGESKRKELNMVADGALEQKLKAWVTVNKVYANAIKEYQGNWVPTTVLGGGNNSGTNGAQDLISLLTAKTAKEIALDLNVKSGTIVK